MRLQGLSFHSVKGGVGKSTLAVMAAIQLARLPGDHHVYLIDMDLTGTSLADVLPLRAPRWQGNPKIDTVLLQSRDPDDTSDAGEPFASRERIALRNLALRVREDSFPADRRVPFLNDFLLHVPADDEFKREILPASLCWKVHSKAEWSRRLSVLPSSAIPGDLDRIVPVIFDEQHAAFLEARLETLIGELVALHTGDVTIVVDVPPTIPGLSRSVISLGLRLSANPRQPLAEAGDVPVKLREIEIEWTAHLVTTPDPQDLLATERWFGLMQPEERARFRLVVNRHLWGDDPGERRKGLEKALGLIPDTELDPETPPSPSGPTETYGALVDFVDDALFVPADGTYTFFKDRALPSGTLDFTRRR